MCTYNFLWHDGVGALVMLGTSTLGSPTEIFILDVKNREWVQVPGSGAPPSKQIVYLYIKSQNLIVAYLGDKSAAWTLKLQR